MSELFVHAKIAATMVVGGCLHDQFNLSSLVLSSLEICRTQL